MTTETQNVPSPNTPPEMPPTPTKIPNLMMTAPQPNIIKKLLPLATFFMAFATVMTVLILYMDNTAMRHYQFRVNMSQDYNLNTVSQDNPDLVTYIREVCLAPAIEPHHHKPIEFEAMEPSEDVAYILKLLNNKQKGIFVESGAYSDGKTSKTEWLERNLSWKGLLIQPDPRHYFILRRHNRGQSMAVHACLSPMPYPKEVTLHHEQDGVKINSILSNSLLDDPSWFNTRVKCFPFYSLLLAFNVSRVDYFNLETGGTELQVLDTIPFDKVNIQIVSVTLADSQDLESDTIANFIKTYKYRFLKSFNNTHIFTKENISIH